MSKAEANRFLDEYKKSRELMESVVRVFDANPEADEAQLWVQAAKQHGFEFSPEDLSEAFNERIQNEPSGRAIMDESELAAVAGGEKENCHESFWCPDVHSFSHSNQHADCSSTYVDRENCWHDDGCNQCYHIYPDYKCSRSGNCANAMVHR